MNQHELKAFCLLADNLHFGRASRLAAMSPSTLSRSIGRLEHEAGRPLFVRDNRRVRLTPAGAAFLSFARQTLTGLGALEAQLAGGGPGLAGQVGLYASVTACYSILPAVIPRFRRRYPAVHILLKTGDESLALAQVRQGGVDFAVMALPDTLPATMSFVELTRTPLAFVAPAIACRVREQATAPSVDWARLPLVLSETGLARRRVDAWLRARRIHPEIYAQVSGNEAILALVSLGCGVGVVPRLVLEKSPIRAKLIEMQVEPELPAYTVGLGALRRRLAEPVLKSFWEEVGGSAR
jgi:LysR family transcriptional regulator, positive regulator for ilvC